MSIKVHLAGHLKDQTGRPFEIEVPRARDVLDVIVQLDAQVPHIKDRILDEHDRTRTYINIFINEENIKDLKGEATVAKDGDVIYILPSIAGGWAWQPRTS